MNAINNTSNLENKSKPSNSLGQYNPKEFEPKLAKIWENNKLGQPRPRGESYTILVPPPNVTGSLHMGHGYQLSLIDLLLRYYLMKGYSVRGVIGTDHAGIATQMVVERQLNEQGKNREDLTREEFLAEVWKWKKYSGNRITEQMRRIGIMVDWEHERFTMDEGYSDFVRKTFVDLYRKNIIYKGTRLVHWDTVLQTAVSDLEVENKEVKGKIWHIKYLVGQNESITVATTRPETMFGDAAIAVNSQDTRFNHLIGKKAKIPYLNREIPIIQDDSIDIDFGTGAVKITPAHDYNDYALGQKHKLSMINILHKDGKLNHNVPELFENLDRFEARKKLITMLEEDGYLELSLDHDMTLPIGDRSQSILEPYLTDQWFMKTSELAEQALTIAKKDEMHITPNYWINTYEHWLSNIQDWCISRQLWWGHRIPAWYDENGKIYVGDNLDEIITHYDLDPTIKLTQDNDVLDTWFSSALWPLETLNFSKNEEEFNQRYPTSLLVTGFDILFFWVARMSMMGLEYTNKTPFKDVLITGLIRDNEGQKMSKSKGNILDPLHLIDGSSLAELLHHRLKGLMQTKMRENIKKSTEKEFPHGIESHGADALRLTFAALHNGGQDIKFDKARLIGFRNFCNKIWNAAKLIEYRLNNHNMQKSEPSIYDKWITQKWQTAQNNIEQNIQDYRFDLAVNELQQWAWNEFCDWYCEIAKIKIDAEGNDSPTLYNMLIIFDNFLKAAHPFMPFITEELGFFTSKVLKIERSLISTEAYPTTNYIATQSDAIDYLCEIIKHIRKIRSMLQISPKEKLTIYLEQSNVYKDFILQEEEVIMQLANIERIIFDKAKKRTASAITSYGILNICIENFNMQEEKLRLEKQLKNLQQEIDKIQTKISMPKYRDKAPIELQNLDQVTLQNKIAEKENYQRLLEEIT